MSSLSLLVCSSLIVNLVASVVFCFSSAQLHDKSVAAPVRIERYDVIFFFMIERFEFNFRSNAY